MKLLHVTDLHLLQGAGILDSGLSPDRSLARIFQFIKVHVPDFDWLVITGDVAHDEEPRTYAKLQALLIDWLPKCCILPGNHDCRKSMFDVFPKNIERRGERLNFSLRTGDWRLIGLDSRVSGQVYGRLGTEQLQWLAIELRADPSAPTLLFMHHPPVSMNCRWLDEIGLLDQDALAPIVADNPQIKLICAGHAHQDFASRIGSTIVLTTPSTSVQFTPKTDQPVYDDAPPGFRVVHLNPRGCRTEVVRVPEA